MIGKTKSQVLRDGLTGIAKDGAITAVTAGTAKYVVGPLFGKLFGRIGGSAGSGLGRISVPSNLNFGTTSFGDYMHIQAGAMLQARLQAQGVTGIIIRTGPGLRGVDITVPRAFEQQLGFRYIEIKPNTASGLSRFNAQVRNWGYDPASVKAVTYDAQGNLRWGSDF
jgi:hypothetical protein